MSSVHRISYLASIWIDSGKPAQDAFGWAKDTNRWQIKLPHYAQFIETLAPSLTRVLVKEIVSDQNLDIIPRFLTAMIWGYGEVGYGPYRVHRILSNPGIATKLQETFDLANRGEWLEAYKFLRDFPIKGLGPAYGTKWLYFCSGSSQEIPIYDSLIAKWMELFAPEEFCGMSTSSEYWRPETYKAYVEYVIRCSRVLGLSEGEVELIIYNDATQLF